MIPSDSGRLRDRIKYSVTLPETSSKSKQIVVKNLKITKASRIEFWRIRTNSILCSLKDEFTTKNCLTVCTRSLLLLQIFAQKVVWCWQLKPRNNLIINEEWRFLKLWNFNTISKQNCLIEYIFNFFFFYLFYKFHEHFMTIM